MPLTRAAVEKVVVGGLAGLLAAAGLDATTRDGTNADLDGPLAEALLAAGVAPADPSTATDADLAAVPDARALELLVRVRVEALRKVIQGVAPRVTQMAGDGSTNLSDLARAAAALLDREEARLAALLVDSADAVVGAIDAPDADPPDLPAAWGC